MKTFTSEFKQNIKLLGRELDDLITYTVDGVNMELGSEKLNSVNPHYEASILKSVMKQLDIISKEEIPIGTEINYRLGVKVRDNEVQNYRDNYDYIDYGTYIVYSSEKQEDTNSYKIVCYDKMLYSMKDYANIGITYPITIRNYINTICTYLGLTFANNNDTFANYDKQIPNELYLSSDGTSLDYTFRDVLDELAQVTASTICINDDDELEIRYINDTEDTIDEEYLKDVNVNFGEKFGPVNVIVLSRSAGSDNIYYPSVLPQKPCELKISDNQIMNGNNRSEFLPDIYNVLNGLEYYINDFTSTGICYYDVCDRYNASVDNKIYSCIMFNDDVKRNSGLVEKIHTDLPEETETDYTKADKTDRKINQTYLIVDKQNQLIQLLIDKSVYISNTLNGTGSVTLENAYKGRLYELSIKGQMNLLYPQNDNLYGSSLVPRETLVPTAELLPSSSVPYQNEVKYPNSDLYPVSMILLIDDIEYPLNIGFLNYIDNDVCDEFLYHDGEYKVIRRVGIDSEGNKYALDNEFVDETGYIDLEVDTNSIIRLKSFGNGIYKTTYLLDNQYTDVFATKVDVNSSITQTVEEINLEVSKKVGNDEVISKINQSAEVVGINANKINLSANDVLNLLAGNTINISGKNINIASDGFNVDSSGKVNIISSASSYTGAELQLIGQTLTNYLYSSAIAIKPNNSSDIAVAGMEVIPITEGSSNLEGTLALVSSLGDFIQLVPSQGMTVTQDIKAYGTVTGSNIQSDRNLKKNIKDSETNALNIINQIKHRQFEWKKDDKHINIGYIAQELEELDKNFVFKKNDTYYLDFIPILATTTKAVQEQQEIIENLKERIEKLERESDK